MEKFNYEPNGYNRKEVNRFINDVIVQTEGIIKKYQSQSKEIDNLKKELEHYQSIEDSLKQAIASAEMTGNDIKHLAREEATMIIDNAKNNADRIVNEALLKAEKIEITRQNLENNIKIFKRKLKLIMEQQMAVVEEIEVLELDG